MIAKSEHPRRFAPHHNAANESTAESHAQALDSRAREGLREILAAENRLHDWQQTGELIAALQKWLEGSEREIANRYREQIVDEARVFLASHPEAHAYNQALTHMLSDVSLAEQWWRYEIGDCAAGKAARRLFVSVVAWHLVRGGASPTDLERILRTLPTDSSRDCSRAEPS
jgi:hypothetical protein